MAESGDRDIALLLDMLLAARDTQDFGYAEVRLDLVWDVANHRLAGLIEAIEPLIPTEERS